MLINKNLSIYKNCIKENIKSMTLNKLCEKFLNGITYYRNIYNTHIDHYAKQNNFKIVAIRTFGGEKKIIKKNNLKKLIMFNLKSKLVKNIIVGINNKVQLDELLQVC